MTTRRTNFFEKIGNMIRGYKGYALRDEKRNTDKKLREELSGIIQQSEQTVITHQQQLVKNRRNAIVSRMGNSKESVEHNFFKKSKMLLTVNHLFSATNN
jgi:hypothetical protein